MTFEATHVPETAGVWHSDAVQISELRLLLHGVIGRIFGSGWVK